MKIQRKKGDVLHISEHSDVNDQEIISQASSLAYNPYNLDNPMFDKERKKVLERLKEEKREELEEKFSPKEEESLAELDESAEEEHEPQIASYYSQRRIHKMAQQRQIQHKALCLAAKTKTNLDDKKVRRVLPKELSAIVFNDTERDLGEKGEAAMEDCFEF